MMDRRRLLSMFGALPTGIKAFKSGIITLQTDQSATFEITTNLGYLPNIYGLWIKNNNNNLIPLGSAVKILYNRMDYTPSNITVNSFAYWYAYKHGTSGNILAGQFNPVITLSDVNIIRIHKPVQDWKALDVNNDPIEYYWFALAFED